MAVSSFFCHPSPLPVCCAAICPTFLEVPRLTVLACRMLMSSTTERMIDDIHGITLTRGQLVALFLSCDTLPALTNGFQGGLAGNNTDGCTTLDKPFCCSMASGLQHGHQLSVALPEHRLHGQICLRRFDRLRYYIPQIGWNLGEESFPFFISVQSPGQHVSNSHAFSDQTGFLRPTSTRAIGV